MLGNASLYLKTVALIVLLFVAHLPRDPFGGKFFVQR
jgi:hypothetical protein